MKKIHLLPLLLLSILLFRCAGDKVPRTIEKPDHGLQNTKTVEVARIEITDSTTVLFMDAYFPAKNWIRIDSASYIVAQGEKLMIQGSDGIVINDYHWMPDNGEDHFALIFPPLPKGTQTIDFIESDCDNCFKIWDIDVTGKAKAYTPEIPAEFLKYKADQTAVLPEPQLKSGTTSLTVYLTGLRPGFLTDDPVLYFQNNLTGESEELSPVKEGEGKYRFEFEQYMTGRGILAAGGTHLTVFLQPGENAELHLDVTAISRKNSRYHENPNIHIGGFKGEMAELNNQLLYFAKESDLFHFPELFGDSSIADKTVPQFVEYLSNIYREKRDAVEISDLPEMFKQYAELELRGNAMLYTFSMQRVYSYAYRSKYPETWRKLTPPAVDQDLFNSLKEYNPEDPMLSYAANYNYMVSQMNEIVPEENRSAIFTSDKGLMQDLIRVAPAMQMASSGQELSDDLKAQLASASSPFYAEAALSIQQKVKRAQEEILAKGGFEILPTPGVAADKILENIVAQYKGQALFIDFWATWCGPCLQAMKTIKPVKPQMKENGVVSLYISYEGSPRTKWLNMLPEIGGKHYYLTNEQWSVLREKYSIQGIPTYMIFDKSGKKTFETAGYPGNEKILQELKNVW